jgi:hypothetical protein
VTKLLRWTWLDQRLLDTVLVLACAVLVVFGLVLPALGVLGVGGGVPATRTVELPDRASVPALAGDGDVTLFGTRTGELTFRHPDLGERLLLTLPALLGALLALVVIVQLLRLVGTLRAGDPFVPDNARRLLTIALAIVSGAVLLPLSTAVTTDLLASGTPADRFASFTMSLSPLPFVIGLAVAALAEFFRRGAKLREDTEGLV